MGDALRRFNALPELSDQCQTDPVCAGVAGRSRCTVRAFDAVFRRLARDAIDSIVATPPPEWKRWNR